MSMPKKGDLVRQVLPAPVVGEVVEYTICQETGTPQVRVEWPDADGDGHAESRWFKVEEVEVVKRA